MVDLASIDPSWFAVFKHHKTVGLKWCPDLIVCQRSGGDDGYSIVFGGDSTKVYMQVAVHQVCAFEWIGPDDVLQFGGAIRKHRLPVGQQHIEGAMFGDVCAHWHEHSLNIPNARPSDWVSVTKVIFQGLQQQTKRLLAVSLSNGQKIALKSGSEVFEVAIVSEYPCLPPEFSYERVAVLQFDFANSGFPDMGDHVVRSDWIVAD